MQGHLDRSLDQTAAAYPLAASPAHPQTAWRELWRGASVIFRKHMLKFRSNHMEIGGTLGWPLLWVATFGIGMEQVVRVDLLGSSSYLAFITPGIIALTALSGAVNSGMTLLEEKIKGILKEYFVAPIPRLSILLASTASGLVKTLLQSVIILAIALALGARLAGGPLGLPAALLYLLLYVMAFVGFSNGVAARSKSVGGYHMLLFVLNLPLLFLSNALYPLAAMPLWMRVLAYLNPTTYVVDGLRASLFGAGSLPPWLNLAVLALFVVLCTRFGLRSFRRMLDRG
ncbi:MAG TPA: ABC transporter permease [Caldilineaceae bacterium]|nr:ABC transporter permease [Caldilineaceae bacterium]